MLPAIVRLAGRPIYSEPCKVSSIMQRRDDLGTAQLPLTYVQLAEADRIRALEAEVARLTRENELMREFD